MTGESDGKKRVNITLDPELHSEARELGLNISGVSERALRQYVQALTSDEEVVLSLSASESPVDDDREQQASEPSQEYADASVDEIIADMSSTAKQFSTEVNRRSISIPDTLVDCFVMLRNHLQLSGNGYHRVYRIRAANQRC